MPLGVIGSTAGERGVGYALSHEQFPASELIECAVEAERSGFDAVWASDHFHPWQDNQGHAGHAWITLAAIGQRTSRIAIGTGVTCPIYRYRPADVAQAFASLALLYPDRVFLGVGTGEAINELAPGGGWGPYAERQARLGEAIALIRRLWCEDRVVHDGRYYSVPGAKLYSKPQRPAPIYVAGSGPKAARFAGERGDGWITHADALTEPREAATRAAFHAGLASSGRAAGPVLVELYAVAGTREDALAAGRLWQFMTAGSETFDMPDPRAVQRFGEERSSPERAIERWTVSTEPAEHAARIRSLWEAGATHVFVHCPAPDQRAAIAFFGSRVLPLLR